MKPFKRFLALVAILGSSAGGLALASNGSFAMASITDDPTGPLTLLLRVVLGGLSLWVGGFTLVAVIADALGLGRIAAGACSLLPRSVSNVVRRSIGIGVMTTVLMSSPAFAAEKSRPSVVPSASSDHVVEQQFSGDVGNGQRWPAGKTSETPFHDPDAPTLIALTQRSSSRPTTTYHLEQATKPTAPPTSAPSRGVISIPQSIPRSIPQSIPSTPASPRVGASPTVVSAAKTLPPLDTYTVAPGDHFWSIARRVVRQQNPNSTESAVGAYCHQLIQHNRSRLHDPHNPDLLHVGTKLELPAVDAAGRH
jgi:LysM domain